ncbi:MAG: DUF1990 family protein [Saprospiraceae bacterium]
MVSLTAFQPAFLNAFLDEQRTLPFSYAAINATRTASPVNGYDNDENTIRLGRGPEVWQKACTAIRSWRMFPGTWARIYPDQAPIMVGQTVAMSAYVWGVWWRNACRIVYIIDEPDRFGFAYGTLPGHVETGEELFCVEQDADGWIWYRIKAFSRPRFWLARLAYPVARGIGWAALYALRFYWPIEQVHIPNMKIWHGTVQALGFGFCSLLGWSRAGNVSGD